MAEINFPDPSQSPWQDLTGQWWNHDGDGWLKTGQQEGQMTGFKNVLINGDFRVNQRGFDGDWDTVGENNYGYDRWYAASPGVIGQKIEYDNLVLGENYTLAWEGGGDGAIYDSSGALLVDGLSPLTAPLLHPSEIDYPKIHVPNTSTNIQLEQGWIVTNFEVRPFGLELALCQRYYWQHDGSGVLSLYNRAGDTTGTAVQVFYPVQMRVVPAVVCTLATGSPALAPGTWQCRVIGNTAGYNSIETFTANAEL